MAAKKINVKCICESKVEIDCIFDGTPRNKFLGMIVNDEFSPAHPVINHRVKLNDKTRRKLYENPQKFVDEILASY